MTPNLLRAAAFFGDHPEFCGYAFGLYADQQQLTPEGLAARLRIDVETLAHLCLCLAPRAECWAEDIAELSERFGANPLRLAEAVK